ncbi:hypothetical protein MYXO_03224 [Myxococcaceae bacterium]|nr:hypothetical protein MYXO_03224 [Myxococcaceae bacterium]
MPNYATPGVYRDEVFETPGAKPRTGVPVFIGYASAPAPVNQARALTLWSEFGRYFGARPDSYLAPAVRGFFENGGTLCQVLRLDDQLPAADALKSGLAEAAGLDAVDLLCAPDIMRPRGQEGLPPDPQEARAMQTAVLEYCDRLGDRFAILDSLPGAATAGMEVALQQRHGLTGTSGALYFPWVRVADGLGLVPPCGHVAGVYARSDLRIGLHKAPANEVLYGVLDLEINLTDAQQANLNPEGVNCLRAFPGRGIRVWGARTLSNDPAWRYVNVRRLFLGIGRWIERRFPPLAFEPHDARLWARIHRELNVYLTGLYRIGALKGQTAREAFYVKCDAETNPKEVREEGKVVTELGLAPSVPNEFVVIRIVHGTSGVSLTGLANAV